MSDTVAPNEKEVQNALSPEEKPIIENIISLFQQLLSMQDAVAPAPVEAAMGEEMEEVDVEKAVTEETGDDTAEERIENVTPTTDQSLTDLNKNIVNLVNAMNGKSQVVKKRPLTSVQKSQSNQVLNQMAGLLQTIVHKQSAQEKLNSQLFDALGFTDDVIKKALPNQTPENKNKPIQNVDTVQVAKDIIAEVFKQAPNLGAQQGSQISNHRINKKNTDVRKNLKDIAQFIHEGANKATR